MNIQLSSRFRSKPCGARGLIERDETLPGNDVNAYQPTNNALLASYRNVSGYIRGVSFSDGEDISFSIGETAPSSLREFSLAGPFLPLQTSANPGDRSRRLHRRHFKIGVKVFDTAHGAIYTGSPKDATRVRNHPSSVGLKMTHLNPFNSSVRMAVRTELIAHYAMSDHSNVASIYGQYQIFNQFVLVMEMPAGRTLRHAMQLVSGRGFPERAVLKIVLQAANALRAMHSNQVAHRNICPDTIMLSTPPDREGDIEGVHIKVFDFADANLFELNSPRNSYRTDVVGSAPYVDPHIYSRGRSDQTKLDVYALGVTMYELICGRTPTHMLAMSGLGGPEFVESKWAHVQGSVKELLGKMLRLNENLRPSAEFVFNDISSILGNR